MQDEVGESGKIVDGMLPLTEKQKIHTFFEYIIFNILPYNQSCFLLKVLSMILILKKVTRLQ